MAVAVLVTLASPFRVATGDLPERLDPTAGVRVGFVTPEVHPGRLAATGVLWLSRLTRST